MKKITLADIAKETGYSVNTVSHALRDMKDISASVKSYINDTAKRMGYIPNTSAGVLRSGKTMNVALILDEVSAPFSARLISLMEAELRKQKYTAFVMLTHGDTTKEENAITSAISKNADAIVICPADDPGKSLDIAKKNDIPCIQILKAANSPSYPCVISDSQAEGYTATNELIKRGHGEILYIGNNANTLKGIKKAYTENNLPAESLHTYISDNDIDSAVENKSFTAVICSNEVLAVKVYKTLTGRGKKIPEDISLIMTGASHEKCLSPIDITSVGCNAESLAAETIRNLIDTIQKNNENQTRILSPDFFYGETLGASARKYKVPGKKTLSDYLL